MRNVYLALGIVALALLALSLLVLLRYLWRGQWCWDTQAFLALVFAVRIFPWPWNRRRRLSLWKLI